MCGTRPIIDNIFHSIFEWCLFSKRPITSANLVDFVPPNVYKTIIKPFGFKHFQWIVKTTLNSFGRLVYVKCLRLQFTFIHPNSDLTYIQNSNCNYKSNGEYFPKITSIENSFVPKNNKSKTIFCVCWQLNAMSTRHYSRHFRNSESLSGRKNRKIHSSKISRK